jgi:flagellar hook protein FlgE
MTSGVSAMEAFEQGLSVIGNNIANVNTTAFKSGSASYADSFSNVLQSATPAPGGAVSEVGTGVNISASTRRATSSPPRATASRA